MGRDRGERRFRHERDQETGEEVCHRDKIHRWQGMCRSTGTYMSREERGELGYKTRTPIRFRSYNIRNIQNGVILPEVWGVSPANLKLGILQETKITDGVYT